MYKLIIVDDEKEIKNGFATYFPWANLGYTVVGRFGNGKQALDFLEEQDVDVIVSDVKMSEMDGIELARELGKRGGVKHPMLVFFSAYGEFQYARQAMQYGAVRYILKATPYEELIEEFRQIKQKLDEERNEDCGEEENDRTLHILQEYIKGHIADVTLEKLAEEVYLSPAYVSRFFKKKTGQNFQDYLIEKRMERAAVLLEEVRYQVRDVSELVGYSNPFNFTRTFKKFYGVTPKDYRKEKLGRQFLGKTEKKDGT